MGAHGGWYLSSLCVFACNSFCYDSVAMILLLLLVLVDVCTPCVLLSAYHSVVDSVAMDSVGIDGGGVDFFAYLFCYGFIATGLMVRVSSAGVFAAVRWSFTWQGSFGCGFCSLYCVCWCPLEWAFYYLSVLFCISLGLVMDKVLMVMVLGYCTVEFGTH